MKGTRFILGAGAIVTLAIILAFKTGSLEQVFAASIGNSAAVSQAAIFALTNTDRISNGVGALTENPLLNQAAQAKADDMVARGYYSHTTPEGYSPLYWLEKVGYKYQNVGENLDLNYTGTDIAVNTAWMNSSEHRENILRSQFTEVGIGVAVGMYEGQQATFIVQEFATPFPTVLKPAASAPVASPSSQAAVVHPQTSGNGSSGLPRNLYKGITGEDVRTLQKILNTHGYAIALNGIGSSGNETIYFGAATQAAVIKFQTAKGIVPAAGFVGPRTRAALGSL